MASSSSSSDKAYDVFISFRGEDVRQTFFSHLMSKFDQKLITAFKDYKIESSRSLSPELTQAIRNSRIAVVIFSENYCSSSWCLDELLEIVNCKKDCGQMVIPVFYDLEPTHVRKQTGKFGDVFEKTCETKTKTEKEKTQQWREALTDVANLLGYHSVQWSNEAKMIGTIADDVLKKLLGNTTSSQESPYLIGVEDHIAEMMKLLELESKKVILAGIWGSSGIGKTTIARTLFNRLSRHYQGSIFVDRGFVAKTMEKYHGANPDDRNMKLDLQRNFLSKVLRIKDVQIDDPGVLGTKLEYQKVLIFIDDLYDKVVLDALVGQTLHFGSGSRIVVVTHNKELLIAHGFNKIYEVGLPSPERALKMFCQYAFKQDNPPEGMKEFAEEVVQLAGSLPLGLNILGSSLRGKKKKGCLDLLPRFRRSLNGQIEKTLMFSYEGLDCEEDKAIFRHIACFFNHMQAERIKLFLADDELDVNAGLENLVNKSLIHVNDGTVEMHCLLQALGKSIVLKQSAGKPGKREFLWCPKDICKVLKDNTGTDKVLGVSLNTSMINGELQVHKSAFEGMTELRFLEIYSNNVWEEETKLHLDESFSHFPSKLKLLSWSNYPLKSMPFDFCLENLIELRMNYSKLEKLWEGDLSLPRLNTMDLSHSRNLKEIPDLSMATNLKRLFLDNCESLVQLPSSIENLKKLKILSAGGCYKLKALPKDINLESLDFLSLSEKTSVHQKKSQRGTTIEEFPSKFCLQNTVDLSHGNIEGIQPQHPMFFSTMLEAPSLTELWFGNIPNLVEIPSSFVKNLNNLTILYVHDCINLETLPTGINLKSLWDLRLNRCSRLKNFPDISTNISRLDLSETAIEEVPRWIEKFSRLQRLDMSRCSKLVTIHQNLFKLKNLEKADFRGCGALTGADLSGYPSGVLMEAHNIDKDPDDIYYSGVKLDFSYCFNLERVLLPLQPSRFFESMILPREEVPSYFTHRATANSSTLSNVPLLHTSLSQPDFFFRVCLATLNCWTDEIGDLKLKFRFKGGSQKSFILCGSKLFSWDNTHPYVLHDNSSHLCIWDCRVPLNKENEEDAQLYDRVDIQLQVISKTNSTYKLKGWGVRILDECSSAEILLGNSDTLPHVSPADEDNIVNDDGCHHTELGEDSADSDLDIHSEDCESCDKNHGRSREEFLSDMMRFSNGFHETEQGEKCGGSDDDDICSDTDQFEVCESSSRDSDSDTQRSGKGKRVTGGSVAGTHISRKRKRVNNKSEQGEECGGSTNQSEESESSSGDCF